MEVTTGAPLYLVSACGSAEEFVAAFRRYADRTGLFVPSAAPLPAGRRGRLAITLSDGGVMIEGEAEILQSSVKPTVLHGRPGMTVKFVEPDEPSRLVIGELEKARLAMKPAPPSVPPRPADIPATPRPVVPAASGRIDAANALAECVVIGDPTTLKETATTPRAFGDGKFVVPAIPAVGAPRPKAASPITQPAAKPASAGERPKTPTAPPDPAATPLPKPAISTRMTSIGFPAIDKMPARTESGRVTAPAATPGSGRVAAATAPMPGSGPVVAKPGSGPVVATPARTPGSSPVIATPARTPGSSPVVATPAAPPGPGPVIATPAPTPGSGPVVAAPAPTAGSGPVRERPPLATKAGIDVPPNPTAPDVPAQSAPLETMHGHKPARADQTPPRFSGSARVSVHDETTTIGQGAPPAAEAKPIEKALLQPITEDEATATGQLPPSRIAVQADANPRRTDSSKHKATSIGFPVIRSTFATQPLGLVPPASPGNLDGSADPAPPTLPKSTRSTPQGPRGKTPTTPPLTPRHPTPVAPVPIVRSPAKHAPVAADEERTDLSELPTAVVPPIEPAASDGADAAEMPAPAQRSGGMRASEILAAIPAGDWTMSPDESVPRALPPEAKVTAPPPSEPTPAPAPPPKGPPTGDWMIALDPDTGWSEPAKLEKSPPPVPPSSPSASSSGNPVIAVASERPIDVQQWDEKPTSLGEAKIEVDSTLMEPLAAMPMGDDDAPPGAEAHARAASLTAPPLPPTPPGPAAFAAPAPAQSAYNLATAPTYQMPAVSYRAAPASAITKRNKMIALAVGAGTVAIGAIVILVLTLGGRKQAANTMTDGDSTTQLATTPAVDAAAAPGSAHVVTAPAGSDESAGSATTEPAGSDDESAEDDTTDAAGDEEGDGAQPEVAEPAPAAGGACPVEIKSIPAGADVLLGKQKLGTAPGTFELPCATKTKVTLRKRAYATTVRAFTPIANRANKLVVRLGRNTFSVKVTSTPAGATIKLGRRSMGVTPTTIRLPAHDTSTIKLTKPGYATVTQRITPKRNNSSQHVTLKRGRGR